jgi:hypothetical protein
MINHFRLHFWAVLMVLTSFSALPWELSAQLAPRLKLADLVTAEDARRMGLTGLSVEQLNLIEQWINGLVQSAYEIGAEDGRKQSAATLRQPSAAPSRLPSASRESLSTPSVVESRINGTFEGWTGETIFSLTNGQIWRQTQYAYLYHYAYSPRVTIVRVNAGYQLQVEGVRGTILVDRLK